MMQFPKAPEADVASGVIHVTIGGEQRVLPTLKIGPFEDEWLPKQGQAISALFNEDLEVTDLVKRGIGALVDAIVAYDVTGALGGRDYLRAKADHAELHAIAHAIYQRHFDPFMKDAQAILAAVRQMTQQMAATAVAQRLQEKSTNGVSPNGDETPAKSAEA